MVEMSKPIRLSIFSQPCHLPVVRAAVERTCRTLGFDEQTMSQIVLALDEALANVICHAYEDATDQPIEVELLPMSQDGRACLCIHVRDFGQHADPSQFPKVELGRIEPGGLGLHIMNSCMDRVEYSPAEGGGTVLTMIKSVPAQGKGQSNG